MLEAPRVPHAFKHIRNLRLGNNHLEYFEEEAAMTLTSLERLDVSGAVTLLHINPDSKASGAHKGGCFVLWAVISAFLLN